MNVPVITLQCLEAQPLEILAFIYLYIYTRISISHFGHCKCNITIHNERFSAMPKGVRGEGKELVKIMRCLTFT